MLIFVNDLGFAFCVPTHFFNMTSIFSFRVRCSDKFAKLFAAHNTMRTRAHQRDLDYSYPDPRTTALTVNQKNVQHCFNNNNGQMTLRAESCNVVYSHASA
jgi:hypothetical protein